MSQLNTALTEALNSLFPSVPTSQGARFLPMLDLSKGELSSTAAIEVARAVRGDARQIAARLLDRMSTVIKGDWNVVSGYMILSQAPTQVLREESLLLDELFPAIVPCSDERHILCVVPDSTTPVYGRLRLISCAALQAILSVTFEGSCYLGFEPDSCVRVSSVSEVVVLARQAIERCLSHEGESRVSPPSWVDDGDDSSRITAWTSHHYHERFPRAVKDALVEARNRGRMVIKIPPDGWLLSRERALSELLSSTVLRKVIARLNADEAWLRWLFHFASSIPSGDLDPAVSLFEECSSPRWSLQALGRRVKDLVVPQCQGAPAELRERVVQQPIGERDLLLRALFLPAVAARAVREGEVLSWLALAEEFAMRGHRILNAPAFRMALDRMDSSRETVQINAGLALGVAGILPTIAEA